MQYICKNNKVNQAERIRENKYKTKIIELEELKDNYKEMEKEKKDVERKYASIKVYEQTKILSEQTKTKLKIFIRKRKNLKNNNNSRLIQVFIKIFRRRVSGMSLPIIKSCLI